MMGRGKGKGGQKGLFGGYYYYDRQRQREGRPKRGRMSEPE